jgi:hypothetical protein
MMYSVGDKVRVNDNFPVGNMVPIHGCDGIIVRVHDYKGVYEVSFMGESYLLYAWEMDLITHECPSCEAPRESDPCQNCGHSEAYAETHMKED